MTNTTVNQDPKPLDIADNQPNDPAEGPREGEKGKPNNKAPSTHVPDTRTFDLQARRQQGFQHWKLIGLLRWLVPADAIDARKTQGITGLMPR